MPRVFPLACALLIATSMASRAATPPLSQLITDALEHAPAVLAAEARVDASRAGARALASWPDLETEGAYTRTGGMGEWEAGLRQRLLGGRGSARRRLGDAEVKIAAVDLEAMRREVTRRIRSLYAALYAVDQERNAVRVAQDLLKSAAQSAASRYASGQGDLVSAARAELEVAHLEEQLSDLRQQRAEIGASMAPLFRVPPDIDGWIVDSLPPIDLDLDSLETRVVRNSPPINVAARRRDAALQALDLTRAETRPSIVLGAGVGEPSEGETRWRGSLGLELPLWRRGAELQGARAELAAGEAELAEAIALARAEAARLRAVWVWAGERILLHRYRILPQDLSTLDLARQAFVTGRGDFTSVLDAFRLWLDDRARLAQVEAERFSAWAEIEALTTPITASPEGATEP